MALTFNETSVGRWTSVLYRYRKIYVNKRLEPYGLGGCQYLFLITLYQCGATSQEKISDYLKIDKTTTAKSIKKMEADGFVTRDVDAGDKRAYKVSLTQKALGMIPLIRETMSEWDKIIVGGISEAEYDMVERLLEKMSANACVAIKNDPVKEPK